MLVLFYLTPFVGHAQVYQHEIFNPEIKSVTIHPIGDPFAMPFIPQYGALMVEFDDIGEYIRDLEYTIIHCNRDWTPSNISIYEYLDGFDNSTLSDFSSSRGTYTDYMHYRMILPNNDIKWKISGNFILKIWDRDNQDEVLMHLRFVVYETNVNFTYADIFRSTRQGFFDSHHELSFAVGIKNIGLDDPMNSVSASVIQNQNWNTIIDSIRPRRVFREQLFFDQHNSVVFPAMREYRLADLRTVYSRGFRIHEIAAYSDGINVTMETDELRGYEIKFGSDNDINGAFAITNSDQLNDDWEVEYVHVLFSLHYFNAPPDADVHVLGAFNNFSADSTSLMAFDEINSLFYKEVMLKQGVYDYSYAVKMPGEPLDYSQTEGFDNRANNRYHVVLYYRPFHGTYDRVIAYGI